MRTTIPVHHRQFLTTIANQMGTSPAKALDYLFWELRRTGFSFSASLQIDNSQPIPANLPPVVATVVEEHIEEIEIDPALQRLIALGICEERF